MVLSKINRNGFVRQAVALKRNGTDKLKDIKIQTGRFLFASLSILESWYMLIV